MVHDSTNSPSSTAEHLYIHVPFCPQKCAYCAFVTHVGSLKLMEPYLEAVVAELRSQAQQRSGGFPLRTMYFGGGTPSLMSPGQVEAILEDVDCLFGLAHRCEVTLEAHPATVSGASLKRFAAVGVTRLSVGVESLHAAELTELGRSHSVRRVEETVADAREAGFQSISLDLMYGTPGQTVGSWQATLRKAISLRPDRLSLYPLMVESGTVFERRRRQGNLHLPVDETVDRMYREACEALRGAGYEHYEVASWALPGHRCRHNLAYWTNRRYFAAGVGAHGYVGRRRWSNVRQTRRYIELVKSGAGAAEIEETLDPKLELVETVMLRTRLLTDGLPFEDVRLQFGEGASFDLRTRAKQLENVGLVSLKDETIRIPESKALLGNEIWQALI